MEDENVIIGALVDSVQEVFDLDPESIEPAPRIGIQLRKGFIKGMDKKDDRFVIILDIERVFSWEELSGIVDMADAQLPDKAVNQ